MGAYMRPVPTRPRRVSPLRYCIWLILGLGVFGLILHFDMLHLKQATLPERIIFRRLGPCD